MDDTYPRAANVILDVGAHLHLKVCHPLPEVPLEKTREKKEKEKEKKDDEKEKEKEEEEEEGEKKHTPR